MSHSPERADKNCLNCGATVAGRYCQRCGQENVETKESFWSLVKHFVYDILHFDGKFFYTLKYLLLKPGFVAKEYADGRRASYLHPIRMYLFTSAVFFLVFFSTEAFKVNGNQLNPYLDKSDRRELAALYKTRLDKVLADSFLHGRISLLLDTARRLKVDSLPWLKEAQHLMTFGDKTYASLAAYDSVQATLPEAEKNSWIVKKFVRQSFRSADKFSNDPEGVNSLTETFLHRLPYLLFLSLPFFAGILKLLYLRRKSFFYSDHAVFTLYHYIVSFLMLLLVMGIAGLGKVTDWRIFFYVVRLLALAWGVYLFLELKRFYGQGVGKTVLKFILLNVLGLIVIALLFILFVLLSFFQA